MKKLFTFWSVALTVLALGFSQKAMADWYVAGEPAAAFHGEYWNPSAEVNKMVDQGDGTFKYEISDVEINANIAFKVTNGSWNVAYPASNYSLPIDGAGAYDILIIFNGDTHEVVQATATKKQSVDIPDVYMVKGSSPAIFGAEWSEADDDYNTLVKQDDGTFSKTYENVTLPAGTIYYKFIKNGSWDEMNANNREFTITESGIYDITFKVTPKGESDGITDKGEVFTVLKQSTVVEDVYVVAGDNAAIFGTTWDASNTNNQLIKVSDDYYSKSYENVELEAGTILWKFIKNGNWDELNPGNRELVIDGSGIYSLEFYVDLTLNEADVKVTKTGDIEENFDELYILGEANDNGWAPNVGVKMTSLGGNEFKAEDITFKGETEGASYFDFTTQLSEKEGDEGWAEIGNYRIGAVSDGAYWVTEADLAEEAQISLKKRGESLRIEPGVYTLFVSLTDWYLSIIKTGEYNGGSNGIEQVESNTPATVWFNLQGQRVTAPTKGIFIHNGRKVVVK